MLVTPRRSVLLEALSELRPVSQVLGVKIEVLTTESKFNAPSGRTIRLVTAPCLLSILSKHPLNRNPSILSRLRLVVCENLELMDAPYELALSILLHATQQHPTRFIGISSSLNDPSDVAAWLSVDPSALHSFRPGDRDQYLTTSSHTFTIPQSAALFKSMAKPAHTAIQSAPGESAIVFVPSRAQCQPIALDLITQCALEMQTASGYLPASVSADALEVYLSRVHDRSLVDFVTRGVGFYHEELTKQDRTLLLELYAEGIVRVLLVPRGSCWSLPVRAATVVVMGTQYLHVSGKDGEERQLKDYGLEELVRMQGRAVRHNGGGHFHLFCQAEAKDTSMRFLTDGLPLESKLLETEDLKMWYRQTRSAGDIRTKQDGVDAMSFTLLARRLESNPTYYDSSPGMSTDERLSRIIDDLDSIS
jgi:antiviral helicase SLH1